jgi:hypothetical protein
MLNYSVCLPARCHAVFSHGCLGLLLGATLCGQPALSPAEREAKPKEFSAEAAAQKTDADKAWDELSGQLGKSGGAKSPEDWGNIQIKARSFKSRHPADPRKAEAEKVEAIASLKAEAPSENRKKSSVTKLAEEFVSDKRRPAKDRYEVHFGLKEHNLKDRELRTKQERDTARIKDARELASVYPDDPRPFGYMLSLAKGSAGPEAEKLAEEILKSNAPAVLKEQAQLILSQRALIGKKLVVEGLGLERYVGKKLVIYTWSSKRPEIIEHIRKSAKDTEVSVIGINVDEDPLPARALASKIQFPGVVLFDGGRAGPLGSQLKFTHLNSIYIVDENGLLADVSGHVQMSEKLRGTTASVEGGAK